MSDRFADDDSRWRAVVERDGAADGAFVYSVRATGVYCRPSCGSRGARRENVGFHADAESARLAGFRACLRCRPDATSRHQEWSALAAAACRRIESADAAPTLAELAAGAGLSRHHFSRVFKRVVGVTPKAFATATAVNRAGEALARGAGVAEAAIGAGFSTTGRFYAASGDRLGMSPGVYRRGGVGEAIRASFVATSLGVLLVAATGRGVCCVALGDDEASLLAELQSRFRGAELARADCESAGDFGAWVETVAALAESPGGAAELPLDLQATAFQVRVWEQLRRVPAGETVSYSEVARRLGTPGGARAVAAACAANPVALVVPCHRVVRGDGSLAGFRWGVERKRELLRREAGLTPESARL